MKKYMFIVLCVIGITAVTNVRPCIVDEDVWASGPRHDSALYKAVAYKQLPKSAPWLTKDVRKKVLALSVATLVLGASVGQSLVP